MLWTDVSGAIEHVQNAITVASTSDTSVNLPYFSVDGQMGLRNRILYNALAKVDVPTTILEVGPWKGASTASLLHGNEAMIELHAIDNWSEPGASADNLKYSLPIDSNEINIISKDWRDVNDSQIGTVNIFVFDADDSGPCLEKFYTKLSEVSIMVVDDWNWSSVRESVTNSLTDLSGSVSVAYYCPIFTQFDYRPAENFWNGAALYVLKKPSPVSYTPFPSSTPPSAPAPAPAPAPTPAPAPAPAPVDEEPPV